MRDSDKTLKSKGVRVRRGQRGGGVAVAERRQGKKM